MFQMSLMVPLVIILSFSILIEAQGKEHSHRSHRAHVHGVGQLSLAFDGAKGALLWRAPTEAFWGFEHEAKSPKEKQIVEEVRRRIESKMGSIVAFDAALECQFSAFKMSNHRESSSSKHSEFEVEAAITCKRSPLGTVIEFNFQKAFKDMKSVEVTVLADSVQKSLKVGTSPASIDLFERGSN